MLLPDLSHRSRHDLSTDRHLPPHGHRRGPAEKIDFYVGVFYYGDAQGSPDTLLTFFAWSGSRRRQRGLGQVAAALSVGPNAPGFATDEALETLGAHLKLPTQYEANRAQIEAGLPPIRVPGKE